MSWEVQVNMALHFIALLAAALRMAVPLSPALKAVLREEHKPGDTSVVTVSFEVRGDVAGSGDMEKLSAQGRFGFEERILPQRTESCSALRTLRYYNAAGVECTVGEERSVRELREPVRLLVAELRGGKPFLYSPSGPLTWEEQQLVEGPMDSLVMGGFLSTDPVSVGDEWRPSDGAAAALLNLSTVTNNQAVCKLDGMDDTVARIGVRGEVEGTTLGAPTKLVLSGQIVFDRVRTKITHANLKQTEEHQPGPIEPGFKVEASFTFDRRIGSPLARLNDNAIEKLPLAANPATEQLVYDQPDGRYRFYFPRGWNVFKSNPQMVILRLVEDGEWTAQCNVAAAPSVAAGTHMKPEEFRSQVEKALGNQFEKIIQEGEVPAPQGHWVYRLAAVGAAGGQPVVWYYHLVANPQGQQLVFIFTLSSRFVEQFGAKDLALVGSLEFAPVRTASSTKDR